MWHSVWLVIKHEVGVTIRQRSFWIITLLVPALIIGVQLIGLTAGDDGLADAELPGADESETIADFPKLGLLDTGGVIASFPPEIPETLFIPVEDKEAAVAAIRAGELDQVVIIPADYLDSGQVTVLDQGFVLSPGGSQQSVAFGNYEWLLRYLIEYNIESDPVLLAALRNPTPGNLATLQSILPAEAEGGRDQDSAEVAVAVSTVVPFIFYFLLIMGSSYVMRSVTLEKENRTAEVILLSLHPRQLVTGKMLAILIIVLVQLVIWLSSMYLLLEQRQDLIAIAGSFALPTGFFIWATLFLLTGFLMYGSFLAAAGALSSTSRETQQIIWVLIIPLMPTLIFASEFASDPPNVLSLALSLFPLTAPSAMVTRIAVSTVPLWQILLSLTGVTITAYLALALAARFFQPDTFLSTDVFSWKRFAAELRRK